MFGLRASGKSSLIAAQFPKTVPVINLLRSEIYLQRSAQPHKLESLIAPYENTDIVVIDEIQKVPLLLDEVHRLIEERKLRFLLTGSSARKLKQKGVNLLAGRAWEANLFPLTSAEIPDFNLNRYLRYGGLPPVYLSKEPEEELLAYTNTYLREEIQAESLVRKIPAFSRFLQVSAFTSGNSINFTSVSNDTGIPVSTIRADTFVGFMVPAWTKSVKRKPVSTAKFYFSDIGLKNTLADIKNLEPASDLYGQAFEHFIALELRAYLSYHRIHVPLSYWRSKHGHEVDFIIDDDIAIEVKATDKVGDKHLKGLKFLAEENICKRYLLISHDPLHRKENNIDIIHWKNFLNKLWGNQ